MSVKNNLPELLKEQLATIDRLQDLNNEVNTSFEIEKARKNNALAFILENDYLDEYMDYTKANPVKPVQER